MSELEHNIQNEIRIWCGEHDILAIRINVGEGYTKDGRYFTTGAPKGYPDLTLIGHNGKVIFCECKNAKGRLRPDQIEFHKVLREKGHAVIVPHSFEDFLKEVVKYDL